MSNLSVHCIGSDCPPFWTLPSGGKIDSELSEKIAVTLGTAIAQLKDAVTITFGQPSGDMRDSLREIREECSREDWDGYGAHAITMNAYEEAMKIIDLMPSSIPAPALVAEPTGEIGFEWRRGKGQVFVISVGGKHRITYAGIFSGNKVHGSEYLEDNLPFAIRQHLRRLYS
ncbi:MAG: hypothetical protein Q8J64_07405 [Thermodesulfovibrionales bacterium]|nr:hypothetical protein [Thermodesulfovibrionales bacterium]